MRRRYALATVLLFTLCAPMAQAGDVAFLLSSTRGAPVRDAVVTAYPEGGGRAGPVRFDWPQEMDQHNLQFSPFVLIVPVGASVSFPNRDAVRHHVYSFSPAKAFELKLYGRDETRKVSFDKVGVVALGCNIHDDMVAFIKVVDTPFAAKSDASGQAVLRGLPPGLVRVRIWHPYQKTAGNEIVRTITVAPSGAGRELVQMDVRPAPDRRGGY
ncbi:MAG: methylamine utilization protein [Caulobacteraceae bacterium]|nr:methylamine utilization protein [Caulobacteraceae bacterium]